ncbi:MAG: hypothetical protein HY897_17700 [Deltaproteobacteria bacterium]|nr:hypothetical protein [Deltaproteobacteria bacterium]
MSDRVQTIECLIALTALLCTAGCTRTDGAPALDDGKAAENCAVDLDCGGGRYCSTDRRCAIDCTSPRDCVFKMADPSVPNEMDCSPCGRCLQKGVEDVSCRLVTDAPCETTADCLQTAGRSTVCGSRGICAPSCTSDDDCTNQGKGWACGGDSAGGWCVRRCFRETDCAYHGWHFRCDLPPGMDIVANADAAHPAYGECIPRGGGIDWGGGADPDRPSYSYRGVWGVVFNTAVRVTGLPIITVQDTVWHQIALAKVTQDGDGIVIRQKLCAVDQKNFNEDDSTPYEFEHMIIPDAFIDSMPIFASPAGAVPALVPGGTFVTDVMLNVRGARLDDPANDLLPARGDLSHAWDQDRDGNPGLTTIVSGVFSGDVYNAQRWWMVYHAVAVDRHHLQGPVDHGFENSTLGASKKELLYDLQTLKHPQNDRSYFRAQRLPDTASCAGVIEISKKGPGTWLKFKPHYDANERP